MISYMGVRVRSTKTGAKVHKKRQSFVEKLTEIIHICIFLLS